MDGGKFVSRIPPSTLFHSLEEIKQPYYDFELAKISAWLKKRKLTMHVTIKGEVSFRRKLTREIVKF
jgi:hypothetical protein